MPNTVVSPNMNITVPVVLTDPGPDWAQRIYTALFTTIDLHDHSAGKGVQVTPAGMSINADLAFGSFNATALRSSRFTSQGAPLALGADVGCAYVSGGELWYNDLASRQVQLTKLGALNTTTLYYPLKTPVSGSYTILSTDTFALYYVDVSGGVATVNLPAASAMTPGRVFFFVDFKRNSATNNITVVPAGADKINGVAGSYVVAINGSYSVLTCDGVSNWYANTIGGSAISAFGADLAASTSTNQWVAAISGSAGAGGTVPVNATTLQFGQGQASPTFTQAQQANGSNPNSLTVSPQAPGAGAASTATGTPGNYVVNLPAPVSTGANAKFVVQQAGSPRVSFGDISGGGYMAFNTGVPALTGPTIFDNGGQLSYWSAAAGHSWACDGIGAGLMALSSTWTLSSTVSAAGFFGGSFGGGTNVIFIGNASVAPTSNPAGGGILYTSAGALKYRGSAGTITTIAPA